MVHEILSQALNGERLSPEQGVRLFESKDILALGDAAGKLTNRRHPEKNVTYVVDRNINYTNICVSGCTFCAFYKKSEADGGYLLSKEELEQKILETKTLGGTQILLQGGLHPDLKIDYYEDLLRFIKSFDIHVHGFSPPEIEHISKLSSLSIKHTLTRLKDAGLGSIPGGGAELLVDTIRDQLSPLKCGTGKWLEVMETAHLMGLRTTATMMYGHVESYRDRIEHLIKLRKLQDKTQGFTAFIPWPFQEFNSDLKGKGTSAFEYLKTVSISRLMLDNFDNIQASWVTQGGKAAQVALLFGANDMGSTMIEENVVKAAGAVNKISEKEIRKLIVEAGFKPTQRNTFYKPLE